MWFARSVEKFSTHLVEQVTTTNKHIIFIIVIMFIVGIILLQELLHPGVRRAYETVQQCQLVRAEKSFNFACWTFGKFNKD